jgi:hypothetical protein
MDKSFNHNNIWNVETIVRNYLHNTGNSAPCYPTVVLVLVVGKPAYR